MSIFSKLFFFKRTAPELNTSEYDLNTNVPKHVAVIMDGNGRWAKRRGMPRAMGHRAGIEALRRIVRACPGNKPDAVPEDR